MNQAHYLVRDENYHLIQCRCCDCLPETCGIDFECGNIHTDLQRKIRVYEILNHLVVFIIALENWFQAVIIAFGFCKSTDSLIAGVIFLSEWTCLYDIVFVIVSSYTYRTTHKSWLCCDGCKCTCDYPCKCCSKFLLCVNFLKAVFVLVPALPLVIVTIYRHVVRGVERECVVTWWSLF